MKNTRKGFTLVELLAVIVILAIIMIIAIPAVLSTMQTAKQKSFLEYTTKVYTAAQNKYMEEKATGVDESNGSKRKKIEGVAGYVCYDYDIKTALGLTSTGNYIGDVVICEKDSAASAGIEILVRLADDSFYTVGSKETAITGDNGPSLGLWNYTKLNAPEATNVKTGKITSFNSITAAAVSAALAQTK